MQAMIVPRKPQRAFARSSQSCVWEGIGAHGAASQCQGVLRLGEKLFRDDRRVARNPLRGQGLDLIVLVRPIGRQGDLARADGVSEDSIDARPIKLVASEVFPEVGR